MMALFAILQAAITSLQAELVENKAELAKMRGENDWVPMSEQSTPSSSLPPFRWGVPQFVMRVRLVLADPYYYSPPQQQVQPIPPA